MLQEAFIEYSKKKNTKEKQIDTKESDINLKIDANPVQKDSVMEAKMLFKRNIGRIFRDPTSLRFGVIQSIVLSLVLGVIFYHLGHTQADVQSRAGGIFFGTIFMMFSGMFAPLMLFSVDREQFLFQNREGLYGPGVYYVTKIIPEIPPLILEVFLFSVIFYWMLNLHHTGAAFLIFYGFLILIVFAGQAFTSFLVCIFPDTSIAIALFPIFFLPPMLFSGFYMNSNSTPVYFKWLEWLSFVKYTYRALSNNEFHGVSFYCTAEELASSNGICPYTTGDQWLSFRGLNDFPMWGDALCLIGFILFFHFAAFLLTKRLARIANS